MEINVPFVVVTVAGLLPAMLISRVLLRALHGYLPEFPSAVLANSVTWAVLGVIGSQIPVAGERLGLLAVLFLAFPQFCCLAFDLLRPTAEACARDRAALVPAGRRTLFRGAPMVNAGPGGA